MKVPLYLGKLSFNICTRINHVTKDKLNSFIFEKNLLLFYVLALFINLTAVVAILPNMAKLSAIVKSECTNTSEALLLLERE